MKFLNMVFKKRESYIPNEALEIQQAMKIGTQKYL